MKDLEEQDMQNKEKRRLAGTALANKMAGRARKAIKDAEDQRKIGGDATIEDAHHDEVTALLAKQLREMQLLRSKVVSSAGARLQRPMSSHSAAINSVDVAGDNVPERDDLIQRR